MAIRKERANEGSQMKQADAFLNLTVVSQDGKRYKLKTGLPLYLADALSAQLIKSNSEGKVFNIEGSINVKGEDINFDDVSF